MKNKDRKRVALKRKTVAKKRKSVTKRKPVAKKRKVALKAKRGRPAGSKNKVGKLPKVLPFWLVPTLPPTELIAETPVVVEPVVAVTDIPAVTHTPQLNADGTLTDREP